MIKNSPADTGNIEMKYLQVEGKLANRTIDYAIKCMGARMRNKCPDCILKGEVISKDAGCIGAYHKGNGQNEFVAFILVCCNHINNELLLDISFLKIYEQFNSIENLDASGFSFIVFDIANKRTYDFKPNCKENEGYRNTGTHFIFNTDYAISTDEISSAELLILSFGIDSGFDALGNKLK